MIRDPDQVEIVGQPRVHSTPRPDGMSTFFSSCSDSASEGSGLGDKAALFNMAADDTEKSVDLTFNEEVRIKDGHVAHIDAPLGAMISAVGYTPDGETAVAAFVVRAAILGTGWQVFDTEDYGTLPAGFRLRITVYNSTGTGGQDAPAAFKVAARVEMFRLLTVGVP